MHFADRLIAAVRRSGNAVLVGIDPRPEHLPLGEKITGMDRRLEVVAESHWDGPIEVKLDERSIQLPLGLADEVFVEPL